HDVLHPRGIAGFPGIRAGPVRPQIFRPFLRGQNDLADGLRLYVDRCAQRPCSHAARRSAHHARTDVGSDRLSEIRGAHEMTLSVDVFWSFRSPYSYLATRRLVEMRRDYDLEIRARPVYPLAVRSGEFFSQVNPLWVSYLIRDTIRLGQMLNIP